MKCVKCGVYLPPGFVYEDDPISGVKLPVPMCRFCLEDKKILTVEGKNVTKKEVEDEYKLLLRKIKDNSKLLQDIYAKKATTGSRIISLT